MQRQIDDAVASVPTLYAAIRDYDNHIIDYLLEKPTTQINEACSNGDNPLRLAARLGYANTVIKLLLKGAHVSMLLPFSENHINKLKKIIEKRIHLLDLRTDPDSVHAKEALRRINKDLSQIIASDVYFNVLPNPIFPYIINMLDDQGLSNLYEAYRTSVSMKEFMKHPVILPQSLELYLIALNAFYYRFFKSHDNFTYGYQSVDFSYQTNFIEKVLREKRQRFGMPNCTLTEITNIAQHGNCLNLQTTFLPELTLPLDMFLRLSHMNEFASGVKPGRLIINFLVAAIKENNNTLFHFILKKIEEVGADINLDSHYSIYSQGLFSIHSFSSIQPLCVAAMCEHAGDMFKRLLEVPKVNVNSFDSRCFSPLHHAISMGYLDRVALLLQHPGILVNKCGSDGITPFLLAAGRGQVKAMEMLSEHPQIDLSKDIAHILLNRNSPWKEGVLEFLLQHPLTESLRVAGVVKMGLFSSRESQGSSVSSFSPARGHVRRNPPC